MSAKWQCVECNTLNDWSMVRCTCGYEAIGIEEKLDGELPMSASDVTIETDIKSQSTEEPSKPVDTEPVDDIAAKEPRISVGEDRRKTAIRSQPVEEPIESVHLESYNNVSVSIIKQYPRGKFTIYCKGSQTYMESAVKAFKHNSCISVSVNKVSVVEMMRKSGVPEKNINEYMQSFNLDDEIIVKDTDS